MECFIIFVGAVKREIIDSNFSYYSVFLANCVRLRICTTASRANINSNGRIDDDGGGQIAPDFVNGTLTINQPHAVPHRVVDWKSERLAACLPHHKALRYCMRAL